MSTPTDAAGAPPKSPRALLADLLATAKDGTAAVPLTTVHLRSGRDLTGRVLAGDLVAPEKSLVLATADGSRVYVSPDDVEAVTVLAENGASRASAATVVATIAPSDRASVQARLVTLSGELSQIAGRTVTIDVAWEGIPDRDPVRALLAGLVEDLAAVLKEVGASRPEALAKVRNVWIGDGPTPGTARQSDTLVVTANFARGPEGRPIRGALRIDIEKLL